MVRKSAASALLALTCAGPAFAACPMELAVYTEPDVGATIEFHPGETAVVSNAFRLVLPKDVVLDAIVMWPDDPGRPIGALMHDCPEGDVTGEEIVACTAWEGVIYTSDAQGNISTLPAEGAEAPRTLIMSDLARSIRFSSVFDTLGVGGLPWDVFSLSGCQE